MVIHYHGTPITPMTALYELAGRHFCVSFARPEQIGRCHEIGQSIMIDNGAFSVWCREIQIDWVSYYEFTERWLVFPTTWAVIPDVIDGSIEQQDELIAQWPYARKGAPVWHVNEPISRLMQLVEDWPKVCVGSGGQYAMVMSELWQCRMDQVFDEIVKVFRFLPWIHMLRGMACCGKRWPFASVGSTDLARSHKRPQNTAIGMVTRWDALQCPGIWRVQPKQLELLA